MDDENRVNDNGNTGLSEPKKARKPPTRQKGQLDAETPFAEQRDKLESLVNSGHTSFLADGPGGIKPVVLGPLSKAENYDFDAVTSPRNLRVSMANSLVSAAHGLSLTEKRIISLCVAKLDSYRQTNPDMSPLVKITAADYAESFEVEPHTAYEQLDKGSKRLYDRSIYFLSPKPGQDHPGFGHCRWISKADYQDGLGYVEMRFTPEIVPLLMNLKRQFTSYFLAQQTALRSVYSIRLLELLSQYQNTKWWQVSIEDFAFAMDATPKQRENFGKIREKIIEPAVKELIEKDGWIINWKAIKAGRRVASLRFDFYRDPQGRMF